MVKEKKIAAPIVNFNRGTPGRGGGGGGDGMEDMFFAMLLGFFKDFENSMEFFNDDDNVKRQICYKLVSQETLSKYTDVPYRMIHDMALVYISIYVGSFGLGSEVMITEKDMVKFGMTEYDLFEAAKKNTPKMFKAVIEQFGDIPGFIDEDAQGIETIYAVTNEYIKYGSTSILYEGFLKEIADTNMGKECLVYAGTMDFSLVFVVDPICTDNVASLVKNCIDKIDEEHENEHLSNLICRISEDGMLTLYDEIY